MGWRLVHVMVAFLGCRLHRIADRPLDVIREYVRRYFEVGVERDRQKSHIASRVLDLNGFDTS